MANQSIHEEPAEQLARDSIYEAEGEQSSAHRSQENFAENLKKKSMSKQGGGQSPKRNQLADKNRTQDDTYGGNALTQELPNEAASEAKK